MNHPIKWLKEQYETSNEWFIIKDTKQTLFGWTRQQDEQDHDRFILLCERKPMLGNL